MEAESITSLPVTTNATLLQGDVPESWDKDALILLKDRAEVAHYWPYFRTALQESHPPNHSVSEGYLTSNMFLAMKGDIQCWLAVDKDRKVCGTAMTQIRQRPYSNELFMQIISLFGEYKTDDEKKLKIPRIIFKEGFAKFLEYAKGNGCSSVEAFSASDNVLSICQMLNCSVMQSYVRWEL